MADLLLNIPRIGEQVSIVIDDTIDILNMPFDTSEAIFEKVDDNLEISFDDKGTKIVLEDFYTTYDAENIPDFMLVDGLVEGGVFFAALDESLMPAVGPAPTPPANDGLRFGAGAGEELSGGVASLGDFGILDSDPTSDYNFLPFGIDFGSDNVPPTTPLASAPPPATLLPPSINQAPIITKTDATAYEAGVGRINVSDGNGNIVEYGKDIHNENIGINIPGFGVIETPLNNYSNPNTPYTGTDAQGTISVSDVDSIVSVALKDLAGNTVNSITNDYGVFTYDQTTGNYTFKLDNSAAKVQELTHGQEVPLTFNFDIIEDGNVISTETVTVKIVGTNDAPKITLNDLDIAKNTATITDDDNDVTYSSDDEAIATGSFTIADLAGSPFEWAIISSNTSNSSQGTTNWVSSTNPIQVDNEIAGSYGTLFVNIKTQTYEYKLGVTKAQQEALDKLDGTTVEPEEFNIIIKDEYNATSKTESLIFDVTNIKSPVTTASFTSLMFGEEDFHIALGGDDFILGNASDSTVFGSSGNDTIFSEANKDLFYGNDGADTFVFNLESFTMAGENEIGDFSGKDGEGDKIDLTAFEGGNYNIGIKGTDIIITRKGDSYDDEDVFTIHTEFALSKEDIDFNASIDTITI